jgi:hypothetical protein
MKRGRRRRWINRNTAMLTALATASVVNVSRNRTLHCALTGPLFLGGAIVALLTEAGVWHVEPSLLWAVVLIGVIGTFLMEWRTLRREGHRTTRPVQRRRTAHCEGPHRTVPKIRARTTRKGFCRLASGQSLEFVTVRIENLAPGWRPKKSYRIRPATRWTRRSRSRRPRQAQAV